MNPKYRTYHPEWHRSRIPIFWWLKKWSYTWFITRELTSVFVGFSAIVLLLQVRALRGGADAYARFQAYLASPAVLLLHGVVLLFLLLHTLSWLNLAPKAMVLNLGGRRIPSGVILAAHYLAWAAASVGVAWILLAR